MLYRYKGEYCRFSCFFGFFITLCLLFLSLSAPFYIGLEHSVQKAFSICYTILVFIILILYLVISCLSLFIFFRELILYGKIYIDFGGCNSFVNSLNYLFFLVFQTSLFFVLLTQFLFLNSAFKTLIFIILSLIIVIINPKGILPKKSSSACIYRESLFIRQNRTIIIPAVIFIYFLIMHSSIAGIVDLLEINILKKPIEVESVHSFFTPEQKLYTYLKYLRS